MEWIVRCIGEAGVMVKCQGGGKHNGLMMKRNGLKVRRWKV